MKLTNELKEIYRAQAINEIENAIKDLVTRIEGIYREDFPIDEIMEDIDRTINNGEMSKSQELTIWGLTYRHVYEFADKLLRGEIDG